MVKVGTWNLENLFKPGGDAGPTTGQAYEAKVTALAETITNLQVDVLAVQEVGTPEAMDDLASQVGGQWHVELAKPDGRGIRVGFLSRLPLAAVEQVSAFPDGLHPIQVDDTNTDMAVMGRPALAVRVTVGAQSLDLTTFHLKSKLLTFPGGRFAPRDEDERVRYGVYALSRRAAEAATVRAHIQALLDNQGMDRPVIALGDCNDEADAATTQLLLGPPGSEIGTAGFNRPDAGDGQRLWNLAPLIPEKQRYSRLVLGQHQLIDHILVSHNLVQLLGPGDVTTGDNHTPSVTNDPNDRHNEPGSDHRPVLVGIPI